MNDPDADNRTNVPVLPPPESRREPLPESRPNTGEDDPAAPQRVKRLLGAPSYRRADRDVAFLERDEARGLRLQLEYLKPELLLSEHGVRSTVVVFGSTRITEPATAQRRVEAAHGALQLNPDDPTLRRRLELARRIQANSHYYTVAREFGRLVAESGGGPLDCNLVVMTGGGPGIMEGVNRGAFESGAKTIGLNIELPHVQYPNPYISEELCFRFRYFALRKLHFMQRARALVAFPGGFGTLDELFEALTLIQTRTIRPVPVILVGRDYWEHVLDFDYLLDAGTIDAEDREIFWYAETAQEVWDGILAWYESNKTPLFPASGQSPVPGGR